MYRRPNSLQNARNNNKRPSDTVYHFKAAPPFGARAAALPGIDERAWRGRGEGGWGREEGNRGEGVGWEEMEMRGLEGGM